MKRGKRDKKAVRGEPACAKGEEAGRYSGLKKEHGGVQEDGW